MNKIATHRSVDNGKFVQTIHGNQEVILDILEDIDSQYVDIYVGEGMAILTLKQQLTNWGTENGK